MATFRLDKQPNGYVISEGETVVFLADTAHAAQAWMLGFQAAEQRFKQTSEALANVVRASYSAGYSEETK